MAALGDDNDVPDLMSDSGSDADIIENDDAWEEVDDDCNDESYHPLQGEVCCLFCPKKFPSVEALLAHICADHEFDLVGSCQAASLDCISYIKMVNFIRLKQPTPAAVRKYLAQGGTVWEDQSYMAAVDPEDLMLQFDIESAEVTSSPTLPATHNGTTGVETQEGGEGDGYAQSEALHALVCRVKRAEEERDSMGEELARALEQIEKLKTAGQELMLRSSENPPGTSKSKTVSQNLKEEDGYFASYTHYDIHMTMLKDKVRTESYRDFMLKNPHLFEGKSVLDVGCGTGILSMFAVKAGASRVVAVDQSNIIYQAMDIARENNMHKKITFVKGRLEDVDLPIKQFDIIISEWMGYFLLFEAMLDSVLYARDRYLSPGGCVYPDHFSMKVVGISDPQLQKSKLAFWDDVYGFRMSCMKSSVSDEVSVRLVKPELVVTEPAVIKDLDVMKCSVADLDFVSDFSLKCQADAEITALVGYFDTDFATGCSEKITFSTGAHATPTHWEQAVMMLPSSIHVKTGSTLDCKIDYRKHPQDERGIIITLHINNQKLKYSLS